MSRRHVDTATKPMDGGAVAIIPARHAALVAQVVTRAAQGRPVAVTPDVQDALMVLLEVGERWKSRPARPTSDVFMSDVGHLDAEPPHPGAQSKSAAPAVTTTEAARMLARTPRQVRRLLEAGRLPSRRTDGGQYLVPRDAIETYLEEHP